MTFMSQRTLSRMLSSGLLIGAGCFVLLTSLQSSHVAHTFAASEGAQFSSTVTPGARIEQLLDVHMPGSLPYLTQRGIDRLRSGVLQGEGKSEFLFSQAETRSHAAQYAFAHNDESQAINTLAKGVVYYHRAVCACRSEAGCTVSLQGEGAMRLLKESAALLQEKAVSQSVRARAEGLSAELAALSQN